MAHKLLLGPSSPAITTPPQTSRMNEPSSHAGPLQAPDFKQVRSYLRTIQQREALGGFIRAGWSPVELAEFARQVFLAPAKTYPTAASYQFAVEKGADHPYAVETLAALRAPGFTLPPFNRAMPQSYAWDDIGNPDHTPEIRSDVEVIARLYRDRQSDRLGKPRAAHDEPVSQCLWRRAYRLRNRYHSLDDTLDIQCLREPAPPCEEQLYAEVTEEPQVPSADPSASITVPTNPIL